MRSLRPLLLAVALLGANALPSAAISFVEPFTSSPRPNVANIYNLYLRTGGPTTFSLLPPSFLSTGGATWQFYRSPDGYFVQLYTTSSVASLNEPGDPTIRFRERMEQPGAVQQPYNLQFQQVQYNWGTGAILGGSSQILNFGGAAPPVNGPGTLQGPVIGGAPEPTAGLVLAAGALALGALRRRARRSTRADAVVRADRPG